MSELDRLGKNLSRAAGDVVDVLEDNAGAIVGGIVGYYTLGLGTALGASWGTAIGSSVGDYAQHGDTGRALKAGVSGFMVGSNIPADGGTGIGAGAGSAVSPEAAAATAQQQGVTAGSSAMGAPGSSAAVEGYINPASAYGGPATPTPLPSPTPSIPTSNANVLAQREAASFGGNAPSPVAPPPPPVNPNLQQLSDTMPSGGIDTLPTTDYSGMGEAMGNSSGPSIAQSSSPPGIGTAMGNADVTQIPTVEPTWYEKAGDYMVEKPGTMLLGASMLAGSQEEPEEPDTTPPRDAYDAEMDAYKQCVASGRTDCQLPQAFMRQNLSFGRPRTVQTRQPVNSGIRSLAPRGV